MAPGLEGCNYRICQPGGGGVATSSLAPHLLKSGASGGLHGELNMTALAQHKPSFDRQHNQLSLQSDLTQNGVKSEKFANDPLEFDIESAKFDMVCKFQSQASNTFYKYRGRFDTILSRGVRARAGVRPQKSPPLPRESRQMCQIGFCRTAVPGFGFANLCQIGCKSGKYCRKYLQTGGANQ